MNNFFKNTDNDLLSKYTKGKINEEKILPLIENLMLEYIYAVEEHGPFNSSHEGYAIMLEEMDELWDEIKKKKEKRDKENMKKEALQIAAMGLRFAYDVCENNV